MKKRKVGLTREREPAGGGEGVWQKVVGEGNE